MRKLMNKKIAAALLAATMCLTGCGAAAASETAQAATQSTVSAGTASSAAGTAVTAETTVTVSGDIFTERDLTETVDVSDAVYITLNGTTASADTDSVSVSGSTVTITEAGIYVLSGTLTDGSIIVDADKDAKVQLVLNGVSVTSGDFAAIYVASADKVFITTAEGTENTLTNGGVFSAIDENNVDAVIWSKDDLTLNGTGTLTVKSPAGHGITCKDDVTVTGGTYNITSSGSSIQANDNIDIADGIFNITAGTDGLHAEDDDDDTTGAVYIAGGTFTITAGDDGIHATTTLTIDGGSFDITASEGLEATDITINGGDISIEASDDGINASRKTSSGTPLVEINGGNITIVMGSGDTDGVDSNGDIVINGGTISVTGNSTFDYNGTGTINGGTVIVNGEQVTTLPNQFMGGFSGMTGGNMTGNGGMGGGFGGNGGGNGGQGGKGGNGGMGGGFGGNGGMPGGFGGNT